MHIILFSLIDSAVRHPEFYEQPIKRIVTCENLLWLNKKKNEAAI
jgi:hypothetical protein